MANVKRNVLLLLTFSIFHFPFSIGCDRSKQTETVVLYTSVDQPVAADIIRDFENTTHIKVVLQTDTEATKSAGLAERLRAEKNNPQADVWWGNEIFHTINLANEGVLAAYEPESAKDISKLFCDAEHRWHGNGLRARVLAVAKDRNDITHLEDLAMPQMKGHVAIARPTAGTTGGHVAALYVLWGDTKANEFFQALRANEVKLLGGNSLVAEGVGQGAFIAGLTDNDDIDAAAANGLQLEMVLPDQDTFGTLTVPTTIALVANAKHSTNAKKLIDYLASAEVEKKLIDRKFARFSVRGGSDAIKSMQVDYAAAAKAMPAAVRNVMTILEDR